MYKLFNKQSQQPQNEARLPPGFAERLLDLELEVETNNITQQSVNELLQLYSQAVEFYSSKKSDNYMVFTNKIQTLLSKPQVIALLGGEEVKRQNVQKKSLIIQHIDSEKQVQKIMTAALDNQQKVRTIIEDDFKMQDHRVQQRMLQRIKDPSKYNHAISKSSSLRHLKLDVVADREVQDQLEEVMKYNSTCKTEQDQEEDIIKIDQQPIAPTIGDSNHPKTKKVREMVNKNSMLRKQKNDLQNFLPY